MSETDDLDRLVSAVLTASRVLVGVSAQSLAEVEERVTLSQFRTLVVLEGHGPSGLNRLAERLGVGASTALRAVDRLVEAGYVERRPSDVDRREVVIAPTDAGRGLVARVTARRRTAVEQIVRAMPARGRDQIVAALDAFATAADEPAVTSDSATALGW